MWSEELTAILPKSRIFDTEEVGLMLRHVLATEPVHDFQDWQPWRALVSATATQILDYVGGILVIPQSVLVHQYRQEISTGLHSAGVPLHHYVLHADRDELTRRINTDNTMPGSTWRLDHLDDYAAAQSWHNREAMVIVQPPHVAELIAADAESGCSPPLIDASWNRHPARPSYDRRTEDLCSIAGRDWRWGGQPPGSGLPVSGLMPCAWANN